MATFQHYRVLNDIQIPELLTSNNASNSSQNDDKFRIIIMKMDHESIDFDLIGIDTSIANALRRIFLAEIPTIAIEHVWIAANSSIIQDEVLAHRIGLIPIKADPKKLNSIPLDAEEETDEDTIVFHLDVECGANSIGTNKAGDNIYPNETVLSSSLEWIPQGSQREKFPEGVGPVHDDIVIAKLKPGQKIELEAHARKGVGKDHTKFSPVATASYRLLPEISFVEPITNDLAKELKAMCPMQVFDIEDMAQHVPSNGSLSSKESILTPTATVARPRDCTMCRECIRKEGWTERIHLKRNADHFIFSLESTGCMNPITVVKEGIAILREKAKKFDREVNRYLIETGR